MSILMDEAQLLDKDYGKRLARILRYNPKNKIVVRSDGYTQVGPELMKCAKITEQQLEILVATSEHDTKGKRFEWHVDDNGQTWVRARFKHSAPEVCERLAYEPARERVNRRPPSTRINTMWSLWADEGALTTACGGDALPRCQSRGPRANEVEPPGPPPVLPPRIGEKLQELTQRCHNAQQENDNLRKHLDMQSLDIADMRKQIAQLKDWNDEAHMWAATAGVRSISNDSGNTWGWKGSNSVDSGNTWWTEVSWWEVDSNIPCHGK